MNFHYLFKLNILKIFFIILSELIEVYIIDSLHFLFDFFEQIFIVFKQIGILFK